jgi:hypothetical protein
MYDEAEPHDLRAGRPDGIVALTTEEREMLREFADQLRDHNVRNPVAREALDRAAEQLERVAASPAAPDVRPG